MVSICQIRDVREVKRAIWRVGGQSILVCTHRAGFREEGRRRHVAPLEARLQISRQSSPPLHREGERIVVHHRSTRQTHGTHHKVIRRLTKARCRVGTRHVWRRHHQTTGLRRRHKRKRRGRQITTIQHCIRPMSIRSIRRCQIAPEGGGTQRMSSAREVGRTCREGDIARASRGFTGQRNETKSTHHHRHHHHYTRDGDTDREGEGEREIRRDSERERERFGERERVCVCVRERERGGKHTDKCDRVSFKKRRRSGEGGEREQEICGELKRPGERLFSIWPQSPEFAS